MDKKSIYKFSENTFSLFFLKGIDLALTIWLIPFLILKVGLVNYGHYAFVLALLLFCVNVINYGFNLTTVRALAKSKNDAEKVNALFNEVFSVKLVLLGCVIIILLALVLLVPKFLEQYHLFCFGLFILAAELFSLHWFFVGMERMKFLSFIKLGATLIFVVLVLMYVKESIHYKYLTFFEGVGMFLSGGVSFGWVVKKYQFKIQFIGVKKVFSYLRLNWNSFVNLLLPSTTGQLIIFLVGLLGVPTQVSFMQIGVKVSSMFSTFNAIITKVVYPIVNRNKQVMKLSKFALITIGLVLSTSMFLSSEFLAMYWLKLDVENNVEQVVKMLKILSLIPFLMAVISAYGVNGLLVFYKDKLYQKISIVATCIMIVLAFLLIPRYYFYGGAIALLGGRVVYAMLTFIFFKKKIAWI